MRNPLPQIAFQLLLLLPLLGRAQETRITGRVVDAKTKDPVPFASIGLREEGTGSLTNEFGYFQLAGLKKSSHDSLVVTTLGYARYATFIEGSKAKDLLVGLSRQAQVGCVFYSSRTKPEAKTSPVAKYEKIEGLPGTQYAFFINNEKRKKLGKLQTVSIYIGVNGLPMVPFRIRFYKADGTNHSPNTDLLREQVFLSVTKGGEWYTWDLSGYNISAPQEGFFVAMEFGMPADALSQSVMEDYTPYGYIMRPSFEFKESVAWKCSHGKGWTPCPLTKRYNAMVKAEVEYVK